MVGLRVRPAIRALPFLSSHCVLLTRAFDDILTLTLHKLYSLLSTQNRVDNTDIINC